MPNRDTNGWNAWADSVSDNIEQLHKDIDKVKEEHKELVDVVNALRTKDIPKLQIAIAELKVKAGAWGLVGSGIAVIIGLAIYFLKEGMD